MVTRTLSFLPKARRTALIVDPRPTPWPAFQRPVEKVQASILPAPSMETNPSPAFRSPL